MALIKKFRIKSYKGYDSIVELKNISQDTYEIFKKFGYFYEYNLHNFESIKDILSFKTQTLSYFGYTTKFLKSFIGKNKINTIDRITKIGDTMKMNFIWDGYNIYNDLTKDIEII